MPIVRHTRADLERDRAALQAALDARPQATDEQIEAWAVEEGGALTDEELAEMVPVYPPPKPDQIRTLRARTGLSQSQFALMFGFNIDTLQQHEQGRRVPSGPASTLLRVIAMEPEAVLRALDPRRVRQRTAAPTGD